jgi:hypothetical protein
MMDNGFVLGDKQSVIFAGSSLKSHRVDTGRRPVQGTMTANPVGLRPGPVVAQIHTPRLRKQDAPGKMKNLIRVIGVIG